MRAFKPVCLEAYAFKENMDIVMDWCRSDVRSKAPFKTGSKKRLCWTLWYLGSKGPTIWMIDLVNEYPTLVYVVAGSDLVAMSVNAPVHVKDPIAPKKVVNCPRISGFCLVLSSQKRELVREQSLKRKRKGMQRKVGTNKMCHKPIMEGQRRKQALTRPLIEGKR